MYVFTFLMYNVDLAAPNRGELWCSVSKETQLRRKDVPTILKAAVGKVLKMNIE